MKIGDLVFDPVYHVGLVVSYIDSYNYTVVSQGKLWKYSAYHPSNGAKYWHLNDQLHRIGGPAIESANGAKFWYLNGKYHRADGPAIEYSNGDKYWYLNDKLFPEDQWNQQVAALTSS